MQRTIAASLSEGKSDEQVLAAISQTYGSEVLLVPRFQGFNTLLWVVPAGAAVIALFATALSQKRRRQGKK
jgi:cytochrome c-type biogenesis protein CcmH/NrfF